MQEKIFHTIIMECRLGSLLIRCNEKEDAITEISYMTHRNVPEQDALRIHSSDDMSDAHNIARILKQTVSELREYFDGKRKIFNVAISPETGTEFQHKVWNALKTIPYGEVRSYKQIAEQIGCPKGFRAVGNANNKNPISIIVPCHRVIGANKKLVGYAGGLDKKKILLEMEQNEKNIFQLKE